ncbi:MAG TPA: NADH-quinone oxidoreductase subunit L [Candidatus Dormibacteraeota bacterium]|jgi:NADH-quinone oxidoreductase subunit L|nr:NADH-quinone oxidoreductase subunit L [Candidatus Dormibacteraeota bacterium]
MPTPMLDHLWIIPLLPLLGAATNGLFGKNWPNKLVNAVALNATGFSFLAALEAVREFIFVRNQELFRKEFFDWIVAGSFRAGFDLQMDQLTVIMVLVVTGVGFLIHIYSTGYMAHEGGYYRFFSYLNLFMFFMLILVLAANYVLLFVGWEGVGLASYLLIGFYFLKKSASDAGKKAFIVNRIGDFGFMLGMFLLFKTFGTLDFTQLFAKSAPWANEGWGVFGTFTVACLLLFTGACGKSAQLPLYVWLPDAMEGPTPVSALIHAATMVTAGVYVVVRSHVLFTHSETALVVVGTVGCATAFFAATIGLVQTDIKKVLAYSTVSQLGYMFLACGVGAFGAGIFHLMTHAFFKALLFLAAGSVIHAMGGEQDMLHMGGLSKKIKVTYWTMLIATLAIAGFPPLAGFFSKDSILFEAFQREGGWHPLYFFGLLTALLTSFYMFRLIFLTFHGKQRYDEHHVHVHESPWSMLGPLVVLAVLSVIGGWMAAPSFWGGEDHFTSFLSPIFGAAHEGALSEATAHSFELTLAVVAVVAALIGLLTAFWLYIKQPGKPAEIAKSLKPLYTTLCNKYYVDEAYGAVIVKPLLALSTNVLWKVIDVEMIDGTVNGIAHGATATGDITRQTQSGNTRSYAVWVVIGALAVLVIIFWPAIRAMAGGAQ